MYWKIGMLMKHCFCRQWKIDDFFKTNPEMCLGRENRLSC